MTDGTAGIAVVGAGWWAVQNHLPVLAAHAHARVVAVCSPEEPELELVRHRFAVGTTVTAIDQLPWDEIDGVVVSTPHHLHAAHTAAALTAGKHVLCEKPLALTGDEAFELVALATRQRCILAVPHGHQYNPAIAQARSWLDEGAVGRIEHVNAYMMSPARELFEGRPGPIHDAHVQPGASTWVGSEHGGFGYGQLAHVLSLAFWLTGLRPTGVNAMFRESPAGGDLYDALLVRCDEGAVMSVAGGAAVPQGRRHQVAVRVYGSDGCLTVDVERDRIELLRHDGEHSAIALDGGSLRYDGRLATAHFVEQVRGATACNPGDPVAAARAVDVLYTAFAAERSGTETSVPNR